MHKLTLDDYLQRVRAGIPRPDEAEARMETVAMNLPSVEEQRRLRSTLRGFLVPTNTGHAGLLEIYDLANVRQALARRTFEINNWHYDRTAHALLVNLRRGVHERLSAALYMAYRADANNRAVPTEAAAERFLDSGLGWFRSTASFGRALKGSDVVLNAQERLAFASVEFHSP